MKFVANPLVTKQLEATPRMVVMLGEKADKAAERCRQIAPVETGEYRDSITGQAGFAGGKARGRVNAQKFTAGFIEFGTSKWPAHATLRRGVESSGLSVSGAAR